MIKNKHNTALQIEENNDAAVAALTFEDLNEVSLPMCDAQEPHVMKSNQSLQQPCFINQKEFQGSFKRSMSRNLEKQHSSLTSGEKNKHSRSFSAAKLASTKNFLSQSSGLEESAAKGSEISPEDVLIENKNLKQQIAQLQNVIVSMCVINQRQTSLTSLDKQKKKRRKPSVNKFIASGSASKAETPLPECLEVEPCAQPCLVPNQSKEVSRADSDCASTTGDDYPGKGRSNRFTKAGLKQKIAKGHQIRSQSTQFYEADEDNFQVDPSDIFLQHQNSALVQLGTSSQKQTLNSTMQTINLQPHHRKLSSKIKIGTKPNYLNKTFSSQMKVRTSVSRTRASSKNSLNLQSMQSIAAQNTLVNTLNQSLASIGSQVKNLNASVSYRIGANRHKRSLSVTEMCKSKKAINNKQRRNQLQQQEHENDQISNYMSNQNPVRRDQFKDLTLTLNKRSFPTELQSSGSKKQSKIQDITTNNRSQLFNSTMERINAKTHVKRFNNTQVGNRLSSNSQSLSQTSSNGKAVVKQVKQNILNRLKKKEKQDTDISFEQTVKADFKQLISLGQNPLMEAGNMRPFEPNSRNQSPLSPAEISLLGAANQDEPHKRTAEFDDGQEQNAAQNNDTDELTSRSQEEAQKFQVEQMAHTSPLKSGPSTEKGSNYSPVPQVTASGSKINVPKLNFQKVFEQQKLIQEHEEKIKAEEAAKMKQEALEKQQKLLQLSEKKKNTINSTIKKLKRSQASSQKKLPFSKQSSLSTLLTASPLTKGNHNIGVEDKKNPVPVYSNSMKELQTTQQASEENKKPLYTSFNQNDQAPEPVQESPIPQYAPSKPVESSTTFFRNQQEANSAKNISLNKNWNAAKRYTNNSRSQTPKKNNECETIQISEAKKSTTKSNQKNAISNFNHQAHKRSTSDLSQERKSSDIRKSSIHKKPMSNVQSTSSSAIKQMYGLQPKMFDILSFNTQDSEQKSQQKKKSLNKQSSNRVIKRLPSNSKKSYNHKSLQPTVAAFCGSFNIKSQESILDKLQLKDELSKTIVQNLATETSNRQNAPKHLDQLSHATTSIKTTKSPGKILKEELFQPILSSKKHNPTQLDSVQISIQNAPIRVTSPMSRQDESKTDCIFTTSSNSRYLKNAKPMKNSIRNYSKKRSQSRSNQNNASQAYDNSDLSDIDKELTVSSVNMPPAPAVVGRTPYQLSTLTNVKVTVAQSTPWKAQPRTRKSSLMKSQNNEGGVLNQRPKSRQQRNNSITDTFSSLQKKRSGENGSSMARDSIFNTTTYIQKKQTKPKTAQTKWRI